MTLPITTSQESSLMKRYRWLRRLFIRSFFSAPISTNRSSDGERRMAPPRATFRSTFVCFLGVWMEINFFFNWKKKIFPSTPHFKRSRSINFGDPRLFFRFIASDLVFRGSHRFLVFLPFLLRLCCRNVNGTGIVPGFTEFSTNVLGIALLIESAWIETSFSQFHHFLLRFHRVLPSFTGFNWFFFYRVSSWSAFFSWFSTEFHGISRIASGFT